MDNLTKPIANLSVAISTRDRAEALVLCIDALLAGHVLPAEIVVVDQSGDDQTRQVVNAHQNAPIPLVYVRHDGQGLGASQNVAFAHATTPIVAVTDDDCVPTPEWVACIDEIFTSSPDVDMLTGRVLPLGSPMPGRYAVSSRTSPLRREFDPRAMPWHIGSGNNFAVKDEWLARIGGNDERLGPGAPGLGGVDMDLFYRLLRAGAQIRYEPSLLVYHARTSLEGRLARRFPYGHGMGACSMLWLRQGDRNALRILFHWVGMRIKRLALGVWRGDRQRAFEEILVLRGTLRGLVHGLRAPMSQTTLATIKQAKNA